MLVLLFYPEIGERSSEAMGSAEHDGGVARDQDGTTTKPPDDIDIMMKSLSVCVSRKITSHFRAERHRR